ncbi:reverse transcriptase domain-containing protein [Tanacetum coccineum]
MNLPKSHYSFRSIPNHCSGNLRPKPRTILLLVTVSNARKFESELSSSSQHLLRLRCCRNWPANWPDGNWEELSIEFCEDGVDGFEVRVLQISWLIQAPSSSYKLLKLSVLRGGLLHIGRFSKKYELRIATVDKAMWGVGFSYGDGFGGLWTANGNGRNARGGALSFGGKLMGKIYSTSKQGFGPWLTLVYFLTLGLCLDFVFSTLFHSVSGFVVPLEDPEKFLIPVALQELDRTNALADSEASINLLPHSIYKQLGLGALKPTRMTLELANRSVTHPMGIAEDVVVRVDGFTFLADFVVVNFEPDPRVPIILGRPFLRTAKALIDLYEEKLTLRVGSDELVFYAEKSEKSKNKQFAHAISIIDFSKDKPFSGSTTNHSDSLSPSSSSVKTSDNLEEFADEFTLLKKVVHEENFQVYSNPLFEIDDNFTSSNSVLLNTHLSDKVECSDPEVDIDEIDVFLAIEVSSNIEEDYYDSEGDVIFLENLLSDDTTHNLAPKVISDHEPKQDESIHNTSITFSPRSDSLHHEFAEEIITLPSRIAREHEEYLSRMTLLCEISTSRSQENVHPSSIPVEDSEPVQEKIDIFLVPDDLIPPGV